MSRIQLWLVQTSAVQHVPIVCANLTFRTAFTRTLRRRVLNGQILIASAQKRNCMEGVFFASVLLLCVQKHSMQFSLLSLRYCLKFSTWMPKKRLVKTAVFSEPGVEPADAAFSVEGFPPKMPLKSSNLR